MRYREDIDGLRALAVLPVMFFHFGVPGFAGGFVGVDIFFVISGFLITAIMAEDLEANRFSILAFYKRRIARILPALLAMLLVVLTVAYAIQLPMETVETSRSAIAAAFSVANIYFWRESGYFDVAGASSLLLHTWSLSAEEQFYIIFPVLLAAAFRFRRAWATAVVWLLTLSSLLLCIRLTSSHPEASFYLLPTRAWELSAGALLALGSLPTVRSRPMRSALAWGGLAMIAYAILALDATAAFPGANALMPVLGALAVLACASGTTAGKLLSVAPAVYIGRISYSLYLVHWPLRVFYVSTIGPLNATSITMLLVATLVVSVLSQRLIEQPFRRWINDLTAARAIVGAAAAIAIVCLLAHALPPISDTTRQLPADVARIAAFANYRETPEFAEQFRPSLCMIGGDNEGFENFSQDVCLKTSTERPNYLIIGDSHAGHLWRALDIGFPEINFLQATASGCKPTLGAEGQARCTDLMDFMFGNFIPAAKLDGIIVAARWQEDDLAALVPTLQRLSSLSARVIVVGPIPEYSRPAPTLLAHDMLWGTHLMGAYLDPSRKVLDRAMKAEFGRWDYVSMYDLVCPDDRCATMAGDVPLQFDYGHFTVAGGLEIAKLLRRDKILP